MKSTIKVTVTALFMALVIANPLQAQDRTEVTVKVTKEGEVVKDTTYQFESEEQAEHVINLMEILGSEGGKDFEYEYKMAFSGGEIRKGFVLPDSLHGQHVIITKSGSPEKKVIKVSVSEDGKGNWSIESDELEDVEENVYIISGDEEDLEIELKKIEELEGDNVKVVVVKKKKEEDKDN